MKWLLSILLLIPFLCCSQDVQMIEVCSSDDSYIQDYWVDDGPNQYFWTVEGGIIETNNGNNITVNWLNVPYEQYLITVYVISNTGCYGDTAYLLIDIDECSFDGIYIPNTFTPNNDGVNDVFGPVGQNIIELELFIFNRWGEQIYESYAGKPWDGTFKGKICQQDIYIWLAYYRFKNEDIVVHNAIGHVVLLR